MAFRHFRWWVAVAGWLTIAPGCAPFYFHEAPPPGRGPIKYPLESWPYRGYWTGVVFNGKKIGFTHMEVEPSKGGGTYLIKSEAAFRMRLLSLDKEISMVSQEKVTEGLELLAFSYDLHMDQNLLHQEGRLEGHTLRVLIRSAQKEEVKTFHLDGRLYPTGAITMLPVLWGLEVGRKYHYQVYSPETRKIEPVTQRILAFESSKLFEGEAFKLRTVMQGQQVDTWLNKKGLPVLEMSMDGILISYLEDERTAKRYLLKAALSKEETLLNFSLVPCRLPVREREEVEALKVSLEGLGGLMPPNGPHQMCRRAAQGVICVLGGVRAPMGGSSPSGGPQAGARAFLKPTFQAPSDHPDIRNLASSIASDKADARAKALGIIQWIQGHIERAPVDVFTALDVLRGGKAECQGIAYLYTALARASAIPTRVANGLVYSPAHGGFLYHTWAESLLGKQWVPVDPTFGQLPADPTHIVLVRGESPSALMPLVGVMGKVRMRLLDMRLNRYRKP